MRAFFLLLFPAFGKDTKVLLIPDGGAREGFLSALPGAHHFWDTRVLGIETIVDIKEKDARFMVGGDCPIDALAECLLS